MSLISSTIIHHMRLAGSKCDALHSRRRHQWQWRCWDAVELPPAPGSNPHILHSAPAARLLGALLRKKLKMQKLSTEGSCAWHCLMIGRRIISSSACRPVPSLFSQAPQLTFTCPPIFPLELAKKSKKQTCDFSSFWVWKRKEHLWPPNKSHFSQELKKLVNFS